MDCNARIIYTGKTDVAVNQGYLCLLENHLV